MIMITNRMIDMKQLRQAIAPRAPAAAIIESDVDGSLVVSASVCS